jgi:hypothetical protein
MSNYNFKYETKGFSKLVWGLLLFLAAAFIVANQLGGFVEIGFWSILVGALALAYSLACLIKLKLDSLPIPLAILYIVIQNPLELPIINPWLLILAAVLASIGLSVMLPKKRRSFVVKNKNTKFGYNGVKIEKDCKEYTGDDDKDINIEIDADDYVRKDDYDNNPIIGVSFGGESRYLHSDALETADLSCKFGGLQVYFDQAKLSPKGAKVYCDCKFGGIELFVPKEWRVIDNFSVTLGAAEIDRRRATLADDAPELTIKGSVAFGAIEVKYI